MRAGLLAVLLIFLLPPSAGATAVIRLAPEELAARSSLVGEGEVLSVRSVRSADGKKIVSRVRLRLDERWKGEEAREVEIAVPGGTVGELTQIVQGMPAFEEGEEVLVFLERPVRETAYRVVGLAQGKFSVAEVPEQGRFLIPNLEGLKLVDPRTGEAASPFVEMPVPLEDFRRRILPREAR